MSPLDRDLALEIFQVSDAPLCAVDSGAGKVLGVNHAFERLTGHPVDDFLTGKTSVRDLVYEEDRPIVSEKARSRRPGDVDRYEFRLLTASGRIRPVEARVRCIEREGRTVVVTYLHDLTERKRREQAQTAELALAQTIQDQLLPTRLPRAEGIDTAALYQAAGELGGDFYAFLEYPTGEVGAIVGDVVGKGIPASLMMATVKGVFFSRPVATRSLDAMLAEVNTFLMRELSRGFYLTALLARIAADRRSVTFCNGGHCIPAIRRADGSAELLDARGVALGFLEDEKYRRNTPERTFPLSPGDRLLLYSDGLIESRSPADEEYGTDRLIEFLARWKGERSVDLIRDTGREVESFRRGRPPHDDTTLVTFGVTD